MKLVYENMSILLVNLFKNVPNAYIIFYWHIGNTIDLRKYSPSFSFTSTIVLFVDVKFISNGWCVYNCDYREKGISWFKNIATKKNVVPNIFACI